MFLDDSRAGFGIGWARCANCGTAPILNRGCPVCEYRLCIACFGNHKCPAARGPAAVSRPEPQAQGTKGARSIEKNMTASASMYASEELRMILYRVFRVYDSEQRGFMNIDAFTCLVTDLHEVCNAPSTVNMREIADQLMNHLAFRHTVKRVERVTFDDFIVGAMAAKLEADFSLDCNGQRLVLGALIIKHGEELLQLQGKRLTGLAVDAPFRPTYEYQKVLPWQEPLRYGGLDIHLGAEKQARIPDPMQAVMIILSLDRQIRVYASRSDETGPGGSLAEKIVKGWPGQSRTNPPPMASNVYLLHDGGLLTGSVESCGLFFIHKDVKVCVISEDGPPPEYKKQKQPMLTISRTNSQADRYEQLMADFRKLEAEGMNAVETIQETNNKCTDMLDSLQSYNIDEVDSRGLRECLRDLSKRLRQPLAERKEGNA